MKEICEGGAIITVTGLLSSTVFLSILDDEQGLVRISVKGTRVVGHLVGVNGNPVDQRASLFRALLSTISDVQLRPVDVAQKRPVNVPQQKHDICYLTLPDGPLGIRLVPQSRSGSKGCQGLVVIEDTAGGDVNGLQLADTIVAINGVALSDLEADDAMELLKEQGPRRATVLRDPELNYEGEDDGEKENEWQALKRRYVTRQVSSSVYVQGYKLALDGARSAPRPTAYPIDGGSAEHDEHRVLASVLRNIKNRRSRSQGEGR